MSMNELSLNMQEIQVKQGSVIFSDYEEIKEQAHKLAKHIAAVEVNESNLKESKKLLAAVNKKCKQLEDARIKIKKVMLEPYQNFEDQVKEIVLIVKDADALVRGQVKQLEEFERQEKAKLLQEIFDKRKKLYTLGMVLKFDEHFLQPRHLNKTASLQAVENEIIQFLENAERDVQVLHKMDDAIAYVSAYLKCFDLAAAINTVDNEKQRKKQIQASQAASRNTSIQNNFIFVVFSEKDKILLEMFMQQNKISYRMEQ